jgi:hypothetical protein
MFTYFMSLKPGLFKTYSTPFDSFWCCVGTGMENHTKYGEAIYFHGSDDLYVNLFIPSVLRGGRRASCSSSGPTTRGAETHRAHGGPPRPPGRPSR